MNTKNQSEKQSLDALLLAVKAVLSAAYPNTKKVSFVNTELLNTLRATLIRVEDRYFNIP